jgi:hypothetical protein
VELNGLTVSHRTLRVLCAITWYAGGLVLLVKGGDLLREAHGLQPGRILPWIAAAAGLMAGGLNAKYRFSNNCRSNLVRIDSLEKPRIWQFFRPVFFILLLLMVIAGASLSRMAHDNYPFLIGVAILDLSIAAALLGSGLVFWRYKAPKE